MKITYYAIAMNKRKVSQLFITRKDGKQISQEWTGKTYKNTEDGLDDCERLNCK